MSNWNDDRFDKRDEEAREGFARLEGQIKEVKAESDKRFARVDERFDRVEAQIATNRKETNEGFAEMRSAPLALNRTLLAAAAAIVAALIGAHVL